MNEIPKRITEDQYDKLMRKLWEMEQRLVGVEKQWTFDTTLDELYRKQQKIEKMLIKIGMTIFKKGIK